MKSTVDETSADGKQSDKGNRLDDDYLLPDFSEHSKICLVDKDNIFTFDRRSIEKIWMDYMKCDLSQKIRKSCVKVKRGIYAVANYNHFTGKLEGYYYEA